MSTGPFFLNDNSHILVAQMYAQRQRQAMAAINASMMSPIGPLCLHAEGHLEADALVVSAPDKDHLPLPIDDAPAAKDHPQPPKIAETLLILLCATPSAAQG